MSRWGCIMMALIYISLSLVSEENRKQFRKTLLKKLKDEFKKEKAGE